MSERYEFILFKNFKFFWSWTTLRAWWLSVFDWEKPRKRKKYDTKKKQSSHILEVVQLQNFKIFLFSYIMCKRLHPCFFDILFCLSENWSFFLKIWPFCLLLPKIPFLAIKMVKITFSDNILQVTSMPDSKYGK